MIRTLNILNIAIIIYKYRNKILFVFTYYPIYFVIPKFASEDQDKA